MASAPPALATVELLGMPLVSARPERFVDHVFAALRSGRGGWVITANVDHLQRFRDDPGDAPLWRRADVVVPDGVPLLWAAALQGTPLEHRIAGSDLVWLIAERAASEGRGLYLLGGDPGAADAAAARLRERWPALRIVGTSSPRVSSTPSDDEVAAVRAGIARARPDVVYVAFGTPKELRLIEALRRDFPAVWWMGVGISLSFLGGQVPRAPRWMQRIGAEWLHRLAREPRRLGKRYLRNIPFTLWLLARCAVRR